MGTTIYIVTIVAVVVGVIAAIVEKHGARINAWWVMRATIQATALEVGKVYIVLYDEKWIGESVIRGLADYLAHMDVEAVFIATGSMGAITVMPAAREGLVDALAMIEAREEAAAK